MTIAVTHLLMILLFYIPHIFLVIFTVISYKKWLKHKTPVWKAAMIASIASTLTLIVLSIVPTYHTIIGLDDPLFFVPLIQILFWALPLALGILVIGWSLMLFFFVKQPKERFE